MAGRFRPLSWPESGDHSAVEPPVPIPNTEVKRRSANGSLTKGHARVGRCQVMSPHCESSAGSLRFERKNLTEERKRLTEDRLVFGARLGDLCDASA